MAGPALSVCDNAVAIEDGLYRDLHVTQRATTDGGLTLTAAALRRLCSFMCPCPEHAVVAAVVRSFRDMPDLASCDVEFVESVVERLLTGGDLLELSKVAMAGAEEHPTWVYCAPPGFVERGERIYIFGIGPDDAQFLPESLHARLKLDGAARFLESEPGEGLPDTLASLGLRKISPKTWLSGHSAETASTTVQKASTRMERDGVRGALPGLTILRHADGERLSYSKRWGEPAKESGLFIGRAPQAHGAPLWYLLHLQVGAVTRSILLPSPDRPERACDEAWRMQLAIDAANGFPSTCRVTAVGDGCRLDFDFPLPMAAKRRLLFLGGRESDQRAVFSFSLPTSESAQEASFLKTHYWIESSKNANDEICDDNHHS